MKNISIMIPNWKSKKLLIFIFLSAIVIRLIYVFHCQNTPLFADMPDYDTIGFNISRGEGYSLKPGVPTASRAPGYPFFLALIYLLFDHSYLMVRIIQALLGAMIIIIIYFIGKTVFSEKVGIIAAGITAFYYDLIIYSGMLMRETLFVSLLTLALLFLIKEFVCSSWKRRFIAGILFGLAILTNSVLIAFLPFLFLLLLAISGAEKRKFLNSIIFIWLLSILVIIPWTVRNYLIWKSFILIDSRAGLNFYIGAQSKTTGIPLSRGSYYDPPDNPLYKISDEAKMSQMGFKLGIEIIRNNPGQYLKSSLSKLAHFWSLRYNTLWVQADYVFGNGFIPKLSRTVFTIGGLGALFFFAILGIIFWQRKDTQLICIVSPIIYLSLVYTVIFALVRFRFVLLPIFILLAAFGIDKTPNFIGYLRYSFSGKSIPISSKYQPDPKRFLIVVLLFGLLWYNWLIDIIEHPNILIAIMGRLF